MAKIQGQILVLSDVVLNKPTDDPYLVGTSLEVQKFLLDYT